MAFDYKRGEFWVAVIGLLIAIIVCYIAVQNDWRIAKETGQFKKPQLVVGIGGNLPLDPSLDTRIVIGARKVSHGKNVVIASIPFTVSNVGDATLENTTVTFRFPKMFHRKALEDLEFSRFGGYEASQVQRSFTSGGELDYSSYLIPTLNPGQGMAGVEPVYLFQTDLDVTAPVRTTDSESMTVSMKLGFSLKFLLSVAAKDVQTRDYPMEIESMEATSLDDLTERARAKQVWTQILEERRNSTFGEYLKALTFGVPDENLYLVYADLDEQPVGEGTLYWAVSEPKVRRISYKPVLWRLLFR